jgi:hypothetical protein
MELSYIIDFQLVRDNPYLPRDWNILFREAEIKAEDLDKYDFDMELLSRNKISGYLAKLYPEREWNCPLI